MKCETCEVMKRIEASKEPACCVWLMENVVCGNKSVEECDAYEPSKECISEMENCKYKMLFPSDNCNHCMAYSESTPPPTARYRHWAHYPVCANENCPLIHPELFEGHTLKGE